MQKDGYIVESPWTTEVQIPDSTFSECLAERLSSAATSMDPALVAIIDGSNGLALSYDDLNDRIHRRALGLLASGLVQTDLVMFFADNSLEYLITMLALIYLGVPFTPMKPASGQYELVNQAQDSRATILMIDHRRVDIFRKAQPTMTDKQFRLVFLLDTDVNGTAMTEIRSIDPISDGQNRNHLLRIPYFPVSKNDHLIIVYTSGTTGLPKGAIHTQQSILASMIAFKPIKSDHQLGISLLWYPFGHVSGFYKSLKELFWHKTLVLSNINHEGLKPMLSLVELYRISQLPVSPSLAVQLANNDYTKDYDLYSLREISFAGSKISTEILNKLIQTYQVRISELYGATEMMGSVLQTGHEPVGGSVGVPGAHNQMKIIAIDQEENDQQQSLPANQIGEICFRGPCRFAGYLNNRSATEKTIDPDGWYHTGDIGYYDQNGQLFVVDRIKELIKFRHWTVSPAEIEVFLQTHPSVNSVCIVGVGHSTDGQLIRAYVQLRDHHSSHRITESDLIKFVHDNLGHHKQLRGGVRFVDEIRRTAIGKIDRKYYHQLVADELITDDVE